MSFQRVSKCSEILSSVISWMGQTNRLHHCHQIKKSSYTNPVQDTAVAAGNLVSSMNRQDSVTTQVKQSWCGQQI